MDDCCGGCFSVAARYGYYMRRTYFKKNISISEVIFAPFFPCFFKLRYIVPHTRRFKYNFVRQIIEIILAKPKLYSQPFTFRIFILEPVSVVPVARRYNCSV